MLELVLANLRTRPFRTLISILGVALGVILITLFTGLAHGMSDSMAKQAANWKAEILFTRPGAMGLTSSNASVNTKYADELLKIEGVKTAIPVYRYFAASTKERWGIEQIDGVDWEPFSKMNEMKIEKGRAPESNAEVIIDEIHAENKKRAPGNSIELFGRNYTIVGIFSPSSGSRIKMSLGAIQDALQNPKRCTYILVKLDDGADVSAVANRIDEALPGNKLNLTSDLIADAQDRIPGLGIFLNSLVGLGALVSTIFVLLSMYTTITERRKEIGILKSLGASKSFVVKVIEGEAFLIGLLGIIVGLAVSYAAAFLISSFFNLAFQFSVGWIATAFLIAIAGSLVGALYPAWRASDIDPVLVLTNE